MICNRCSYYTTGAPQCEVCIHNKDRADKNTHVTHYTISEGEKTRRRAKRHLYEYDVNEKTKSPKERGKRTYRYWTKEEENYLNENRAVYSTLHMAEVLGRSYLSVENKLHRLLTPSTVRKKRGRKKNV